MLKLFISLLFFVTVSPVPVPEVHVSGAMRNIMMNADLSAHIRLDTLGKKHLFGLGPAALLKGEIMILDGKIYSTAVHENKLINQQDKITEAAMLVYSYVEKWKAVNLSTTLQGYAELENMVETTAKAKGYDTEIPFVFRIELTPEKASYHVIDWKEGITHTMENHKQFAYTGETARSELILLGFYSKHHQSIYTHHTTFMHVHLLDEASHTVGHIDDIRFKGPLTLYLPEK
jgi:acetolactate decarboxylase